MPKEELNAFDVLALVRELQVLVGGRLDKVFQPSREEVLLRFRLPRGGSAAPDAALGEASAEETEPPAEAEEPGAGGKRELVVHVGKWLCLTRFPREMPLAPPAFSMNLRKHVSGARVVAVRQHAFDRVVEIDLEKKEGSFTLVLELFHDGNVILVKGGRIVTPLLHQSWATREVRPGAEFRPPPERFDPKIATEAEFLAKFRLSSSDAVRTLAVELNLGGQYAEEVCARARVAKNAPVADVGDEEARRLFAALRLILERVEFGDLAPAIVRRGGEKLDATPVPLAEHEGLERVEHPAFNDALDQFFSKVVTVERVDPRLKRWEEERAKAVRMRDSQRAAVAKFETEDVEAKERGDLLFAHFELVTRLAERILRAAKEHGWKEVQEKLKGAKRAGHADASHVDSLDPHEGVVRFVLEDFGGRKRKVAYDLTKTVQENANANYERGKKMREKLAGARTALAHTEAKLRDMDAKGAKLASDLEAERAKAKPTRRFWFDGYRWFLSSDGLLVIGGRDAASNEKVVKKHLDDADRYVHADLHGASSIVVKAKGGEVPERTLEEAAAFAVATSRAWQAGVAAGDAYWVTPAQVSKTPNPGEYVAKGAFIIRGKRTYVQARVRYAVGEVEVEGHRKVMGGPEAAVAARSKRYLVIEPGDENLGRFAARLAKALDVPVEEVQSALPPGDVRVVEQHGGLLQE